MTEQTEDIGKAKLDDVRLSFPHLKEPHASVKDGPKKFRATFLLDPGTDDGSKAVKAAKRAALAVAKEAWPKAEKTPVKADRKMIKKGNDFIDQKTGEIKEGYKGMVVVVASSNDRPLCLHRNKRVISEAELSRVLYAGCRVDAIVRFYTITDPDKGGNGLFCSLEAIRFRGDDEAFSKGSSASADDFDDLEDEDAEEENEDGFDDDEDDDDLL